jgi:excisionase family DNA binding protein
VVTKEQVLGITVEQAARRLGIGRSLAYEMANDGRLPVVRFGRCLRVSVPALEKMMADAGQRQDRE